MSKFVEKTWADYDIGNLGSQNEEVLRKAVKKAAKAANMRLLRLERAGYSDTWAHRMAMENLKNISEGEGLSAPRKRFKEYTKNMDLYQLRREYTALREFLSMKSSTVQGLSDTQLKRYNKAVEKGFNGSLEEFNELIEKYFGQHYEKMISSDIVYQAITGGKIDVLNEVIRTERARVAHGLAPTAKGSLVAKYLAHKKR